MKELLEELERVWPKDSVWECRFVEESYGHRLEFSQPVIVIALRYSGDDIDSARARTIIEEELRNLGCYRLDCIWDDEGTRIYAFILERSYQAVAPTRTEALLAVAIQAFKEEPHP